MIKRNKVMIKITERIMFFGKQHKMLLTFIVLLDIVAISVMICDGTSEGRWLKLDL